VGTNPLVVAAALSAAAVVAQAGILREALSLTGGADLLAGLVLAGWFAGSGLGSALAARLKWGRLSPARLVLLCLAGGGLPLAGLVVLGLGRQVLGTPVGQPASAWRASLLCLGVSLPLAATLAACIPPLLQQLVPGEGGGAAASRPRLLDRLLGAQGLGSLLGGVLLTGLLVTGAGALVAQAVALSIVALAGATWLGRGRVSEPGGRWFAAAMAALVGVAALGGSWWAEGPMRRAQLESLAPGSSLLQAWDAPGGSALLARRAERTTLYLDGLAADGFPDASRDGPRAARLLVQHPQAKRVCLLGAGMTGLTAQLLAAGVPSVVVVLPDHLLAAKLAPHLPQGDAAALAHARVDVVYSDPRRHLASDERDYDLIVVLGRGPGAAANRLYTEELIRLASRRLGPGGVLALELHPRPAAVGGEAGDLAASVWASLGRVLPYRLALPANRVTLLGSRSPDSLSADVDVLDARLEALPGRTGRFSGSNLVWDIPQRSVQQLMVELADRSVLPNTDRRPVANLYRLLHWTQEPRSGGDARGASDHEDGLLRGAARWDPRWAGLVALLLLPALFALRGAGGPRRRARAVLLLGSVAAAALVVQVALLVAYQNLYGALPWMVAGLVASAMVGFAAGGLVGARWQSRWGRLRRPELCGLVLMPLGLAPPVLVVLLGGGAPGWLGAFAFLLAAAATGGVHGLTFALLSPTIRLAAQSRPNGARSSVNMVAQGHDDDSERVGQQRGAGTRHPAQAAGAALAGNYIGAAAGAAVTGTVLLPVLGLDGAAALAVALAGVAAVLGVTLRP